MAATRRKNSIHKYECSNWFNEYSSQRYPLHIDDVSFVDITSKKTPQRNAVRFYRGCRRSLLLRFEMLQERQG